MANVFHTRGTGQCRPISYGSEGRANIFCTGGGIIRVSFKIDLNSILTLFLLLLFRHSFMAASRVLKENKSQKATRTFFTEISDLPGLDIFTTRKQAELPTSHVDSPLESADCIYLIHEVAHDAVSCPRLSRTIDSTVIMSAEDTRVTRADNNSQGVVFSHR